MRKKYEVSDILASGESLLRQQGYHNTGIDQILKVNGIPKGSFYNFFKSKEDFGLRVLDFYGGQYHNFIQKSLTDQSKSPLQRLKDFYRLTIEGNRREQCKHGCLINNLSLEIAGSNDNFSRAINRHIQQWIAVLAGCIEEGQDRGQITQNYSAHHLAEYMQAGFFGTLSRSKAARSSEAMERFYRMSFDFITDRMQAFPTLKAS